VLIECAFSWVLSIARHGTGTRLSPLRVEFIQPRKHAKAIERHFGCPVVCGAPRNAIIFRASDAMNPFVTRNAALPALGWMYGLARHARNESPDWPLRR